MQTNPDRASGNTKIQLASFAAPEKTVNEPRYKSETYKVRADIRSMLPRIVQIMALCVLPKWICLPLIATYRCNNSDSKRVDDDPY